MAEKTLKDCRIKMASAELMKELTCSICLSLYTDPISPRCGHNFCGSCIVLLLDTQDKFGGYSCPDCRKAYFRPPVLEKNTKLGNKVKCLFTLPDMEDEARIFCIYCIKSPVPAVKSCLQCEISLCHNHLAAHNKAVNHILAEPTGFFDNKKCPIHKKVLEFYCSKDLAFLCVSCLVGKHRGHQVELLDEAAEEKKKKLRKYLDELNSQKAEVQTRIQNLHDHQRNIQEKASNKRINTTGLFDIKGQLKIAVMKALSEITRQEEEIVSEISNLIKEQKIKEEKLCRKVRHLEKVCHVTDPIRLLQESDIILCGHGGEDTGGNGGIIKSEYDLDEVLISLTLYRSMRDIVTTVPSQLGFQVPDILLDDNTAHRYVKVSKDLKTATNSGEEQYKPELNGRFPTYFQVLSRCGLSSGRHYWEVEWNQIGHCDIGMSCANIERNGDESGIKDNNNSWCLTLDDEYWLKHDSFNECLCSKPTSPTLGVFLDYEAGRLSFYELCDPIRHLHTFTASFTEPLHVVFYVYHGASLTIRS